ncbi:hypothetical protein FZC83_02015 [Rossellomorea marisflavi]|uniref:Uncharacterized protein n=1 Tax=Rossellomorea marisflavi TaxID=189381 RepID=A0A5D4S1D4_9BACI|nr:hypothetical protein [Rossellomorea marisflavi]TYS56371.1 hypothetical protein FZC83_02015 [Rossellomorea marisflavi]
MDLTISVGKLMILLMDTDQRAAYAFVRDNRDEISVCYYLTKDIVRIEFNNGKHSEILIKTDLKGVN